MLTVLNEPSPRKASRFDRTAVDARYTSGFYELEADNFENFRWMGLVGRIDFEPPAQAGFAELRVWSEFFDLRQHLTVEAEGAHETFELPHGWWTVSLPVPAGCSSIVMRTDRQLPQSARPGDTRQLGVRIATPRVHRDSARHRTVTGQLSNAVRNTLEAIDGRVELRSTPTSLGIDMYGVCNVKPPCVYCDWDHAKRQEQDNVEVPFNLDTLGEYGAFFDSAASLINCSIGEPFMMKDFDALLDAFGDGNKLVEMTTNGQILTDRNIRKLLGRRIELYVSLDAATAETYAKLRNNTFDRILNNLRRLIDAKGGRGGLPRIHLVFMPMKVNVHELEPFVKLCAELDADRFVLRPLNEIADELEWTRAGNHFVYSQELLDFETLARLSARATALCRLHRVPFSNQLDFGGEMQPIFQKAFDEALVEVGRPFAAAEPLSTKKRESPRQVPEPEPSRPEMSPAATLQAKDDDATLGDGKMPVCLEPWKSLYILRRGVLPCCYGHEPVASMGEYRDTWNAPILKDIRRHLARGEFHTYCLDSPSCPIVRKTRHVAAANDSVAVARLSESIPRRIKRRIKALDEVLLGGAGIALYRRVRTLREVRAS